MSKEYVKLTPFGTESIQICAKCHGSVKSNGFKVTYYPKDMTLPAIKFEYICNQCVRYFYPNYFKDKEKK